MGELRTVFEYFAKLVVKGKIGKFDTIFLCLTTEQGANKIIRNHLEYP